MKGVYYYVSVRDGLANAILLSISLKAASCMQDMKMGQVGLGNKGISVKGNGSMQEVGVNIIRVA